MVIDNRQLHPRTELAKIYQRQGKLQEAEKVIFEALGIDGSNCFVMAELIAVYNKQFKDKKCLRMFDDFLKNVVFGKGREHQAMFNNIFKLCARFNRKDEAAEYFHKYSCVLDEQNIALYHRLFP